MSTFFRCILLLLCLFLFERGYNQISSCKFTLEQTSGCAPLPILATPAEVSASPIVARKWYLTSCSGTSIYNSPAGLNSTFSFAVTDPGCYCLRLWSQNQDGDTCSSQQCNIIAAVSPTIDFSFTPGLLQGCQPFTINSICNSTAGSGTIDSIIIDWGCSSISEYSTCAQASTSHTYSNCPLGCISPTVVIKNSFNCYADTNYSCLVDIIPDPVASFTADTTAAYCTTTPLLVHFTAAVTDPDLTYSWYINNALVQSGSSQFLTYSFPVSATCYDVKLAVYHPSGCADSVVRTGYICVESHPAVSFSPVDTSLCVGQALVLTNTTPGISSLTWQLTGGNPPQTFTSQTGASADFVLPVAGTYTATVTGVFSPGCSATITRQVATASLPPSATITASDTFSCKVPLVSDFTTPGCAKCIYSWTFGTIGPITTQNPVVTFPLYNTYPAQLVVTDTATGCSATSSQSINIHVQRINPQILASGFKGCTPECVNLQNKTNLTGFPANVTISSVCWTFPGTTITGACQDTINRCFTVPGCYSVQLTMTTNTGCRDSLLLPDTLCAANPPTCSFKATPDTVCFEADTIQFKLTCDSFSFARVNFHDGPGAAFQTFLTPQFTHQFSGPGHYCITAVTYKDSCAGDTLSVCVQINYPVAKFKDSTSCALGDTVYFVNQSEAATSYMWSFCDGMTSNLEDPYKVFSQCDTCTITLQVYNDSNGCHHQKSLFINTPCNLPSFTVTPASGCAPLRAFFQSTSQSSDPGATLWNFNCSDTGNWYPEATYMLYYTFDTPGIYCIAMRNVSPSGCYDTAYSTVKVCNITAGFGYDTNCYPIPICFHDSSINYCLPTTWHWDFGDGDTSDLQNPCHLYATTGIYPVSLVVSNGICSATATQQVGTSAAVNINFDVDTIVCPGSSLCVQDNSSGIDLVYNWYAPGAVPSTSNAAAPCFTYNNPIDTLIYFQLSSNNQCSFEDTIRIHAHTPIAAGYVTPTYIPCPTRGVFVDYIDTSLYVDSTQFWSFGDKNGVVVSDVNPTHIYAYPGIYVVTLVVIDKSGCTDTSIIDTVHVSGPFGDVTFTPSPGVCACQDSIHYSVNTWNASTIAILYGCNQGFSFDSIPDSATAADTTHFEFAAWYCIDSICTPTIQVTDSNGCQVYLPTTSIYADSPTVVFNFNDYGVCQAGQICFHDSTYYHLSLNQSFTVQRLWEFGDNETDTAANPCHYYAGPGNYTVKLIVTSNLGCVDSNVVAQVIIPAFPIAGFIATDSFVCDKSSICFQDTSYIYPLTGPQFWTWNFGDGSGTDTIYTRNICHTYNATGYYTVTECVTDSFGCSNCDSSTVIHVVANPVASTGGNPIVCYGVITQLHASGGETYSWSPRAIFTNPDSSDPFVQLYADTTVSLVVANTYGCKDTTAATIFVAKVNAGFIADSISCQNDSLCATNNSSGLNDSLVSWQYNFGDGNLVDAPNACNLYAAPGNYTITFLVTDNHGCNDSVTAPVKILPSPDAKFSLNDSVICSNQQICITDLTSSVTPISSWLWNYGDGNTSSGATPPCHTYSPPYQRSYDISLVVVDQNNCVDTAQIGIILNVIPKAIINWTVSCENDSMPLASASIQGSGSIIFCQWVIWLGASNPLIDSDCYTNYKFPPGTHDIQLVVRDVNGCSDTATAEVITDSLTQLVVNPGDTTICLGTAVNYTVGGVFTAVSWSPDVWISNPDSPTVTMAPLSNIEYYITAVNGVCPSVMDTFKAKVIQPVPIEINSTLGESLSGRDLYQLMAKIAGVPPGVTIDSLIWTPDSTLSCNNCPSPLATPYQNTTYTATVYYSEDGVTCSNSAQITIDINGCDKSFIFVPNTFTPNGDGLNDVLMIRSASAPKIISFRIFDRWGRVVFDVSNGYPNEPKWGWNGTDMTGKKLNTDVYVYTYQIECYNGSVVNGQGNVTLLR